MTHRELSLSTLWEKTALLEETLYFKNLEIQELQREIEVANKKAARFEVIAIDLSHQAKQLAKYAQSLRPEAHGGII